ncbi:MAG: tetratricopeptide repeat protein [Acidobacteriota bacterium]
MMYARIFLRVLGTGSLIFSCATWAQSAHEAEAATNAAAGQQALAHGDYAAAQGYFEKLAQLDPGVAEIHATLAAICFKQREYEQAIAEIHTAQRLKPGLPKLDSLLGLSLSEEGEYAEALPHLEKGFRQGTDPEVRRMCGLELLRAETNLERDADAVATSLSLNRLYPDDPEVLYHTGRIYGNFAYETLEKLHDTAPGSIWMLQAQGEANESQKNWEGAIIAFNHVLTMDPHRPGIHYQLGRVYLSRFRDAGKPQDRDAAMREFRAELDNDPSNGNAGYELAYLQAEAGDTASAAEQYSKILQQYPDFEEALVGLAGIDLTSQKPNQAVPLLEHAVKLHPNDEVAWWRLAQADRAVGDTEGQKKALAEFNRIHQVIPGTLRNLNADAVTPQHLDAKPGP